MSEFKIFRVSASANEQFDWEVFVHATSVEDAYSKLEQFDKDYADFIECGNDIYRVDKLSDTMFKLVESVEIPF